MKFKKISLIIVCMISFSAVNAEIIGKMIGGEPVETWQDGGQDFFVMFNSNIDDQITLLDDDPENPQGDTCLSESVFTLTDFHIPEDAIIDKAYLIWMGAVDPEKLDEPTDNSVKLKFTQSTENPVSYEQVVTVGETGKLLTDANSFEFESLKFTDDVITGCSETELGINVLDQEIGYFTYRADVTDFFTKIGDKFYGDYTFSDLDCTEHDFYRCRTTMVSSWAVFFVYRSKSIRQKKIYFYNGLSFVQGDESVANVSGFEFPESPEVRLAIMTANGDPGIAVPQFPAESVMLKSKGVSSMFRLYNECNPMMGSYVDVFNSKSSVINWDPSLTELAGTSCFYSGNVMSMNYGIDVDTFYLRGGENKILVQHLKEGITAMDITLSVNQDTVFTNFMVLSVDNKNAKFDIPPEASDLTKSKLNFPYDREKHFCACPSNDDGQEPDYYCETVTSAREFYYFIKVQNWGDENSENAEGIVVYDELDKQLEYIPGSTEMATQYNFETDTYCNWKPIPDKDGNIFPLSGAGFKVSTKMASCDKSDWSCTDTVLIRYKVKPKVGTSKDYVFENTAFFRDGKSEDLYKTNRSYPLRLKPTKCVTDTQCASPTPEMCGGSNCGGCIDDDPVPDSDNNVNNDAEINDNNDSDTVDVDLNDEDSADTDKSSNGCGCSLI